MIANVLPTVAGDAFSLDGVRFTIEPACLAEVARRFACVTHGLRLANIHQLEEHLAISPGAHVIARYCEAHRVFEEFGEVLR